MIGPARTCLPATPHPPCHSGPFFRTHHHQHPALRVLRQRVSGPHITDPLPSFALDLAAPDRTLLLPHPPPPPRPRCPSPTTASHWTCWPSSSPWSRSSTCRAPRCPSSPPSSTSSSLHAGQPLVQTACGLLTQNSISHIHALDHDLPLLTSVAVLQPRHRAHTQVSSPYRPGSIVADSLITGSTRQTGSTMVRINLSTPTQTRSDARENTHTPTRRPTCSPTVDRRPVV